MISIDGSRGEGGGQILRSALSLSMVTGQPFRIRHIRANRPKPGLMRQHLTCVQAAAAICSGKTTGADLASTQLEFKPGKVQGGSYNFAIGTAGSTTLVLQTILPALMTTAEGSRIDIAGGTHNLQAPTTCFLAGCFLPLIDRMGPSVRMSVGRLGFYPAGGGVVRTEIEPVRQLLPLHLTEPSPIIARRAVALVAGLPGTIAQRELAVVEEKLGWSPDQLSIRHLGSNDGPGNTLTLEIERESLTEVFTGFGERGVSAEQVAARVCGEVRSYLAAEVPVWKHLADQLLLPMALAGQGSFRTGPLTPHALSNADVIEQFVGTRIHRQADAEGRSIVTLMS
jgi:RNA 3'-terminal phosphate cyclase (ATP)